MEKRLLIFLSLILGLFNYKAQEKYADSLKEILKSKIADTTRLNTYYTLVYYYLEANLDSAEKYNSIGIKLAEQTKNNYKLSYFFDEAGFIKLYKGEYEKSIINHIKALKLHESFQDSVGLTYSLNGIGFVYNSQLNYKKALQYYNQSLEIARRINHPFIISICLKYLGSVYKYQGKQELALKNFSECLKIISKSANKIELADLYLEISTAYLHLVQIDSCLSYGKKALFIYNQYDGLKSRKADIISVMGSAYLADNNPNSAKEYLLKSFEIASQLGVQDIRKGTSKELALVFEKLGDYKNAYKYSTIGLRLTDSLNNLSEIDKHEKNYIEEKELEIKQKEELIKIKEEQIRAYKEKTNKYIILFVFIVFSLSFAFLFIRYKSNKKANVVLEEKNKLISEKQKEIFDSINYAKRIQHALLANELVLKENLQNFFVLFKPKDIVSGDFYWAIEHQNYFFLAVCDCTGHGVPGAFMSLLNMNYLNEAVKEKEILEPNEILNFVRNKLTQQISHDGSQDGMDAILLRFDKKNKALAYSSANNTILETIGNKINIHLADKMPVGKSPVMAPFTLREIKLDSDSIFYLYTDGFADQFGGPKGKKFKNKALNNLLLEYSGLEFSKQKELLEDWFETWKGNLEQVDDVCVLGLKIKS